MRFFILVIIELALILVHAIIYTDSISSNPGVLGENPVVRFAIFWETSAVYDMDLRMFLATLMGAVTVISAIAFFMCLLAVQMVGLPGLRNRLFFFLILTLGAYGGALMFEYILLTERLAVLAADEGVRSEILGSLGVDLSNQIGEEDKEWISVAFTVMFMFLNAIIAWFTADEILEHYDLGTEA